MAVLFSDNFDRVGGTLGAGWTEQGSPGATNMSTDGDYAQVDTNPIFHVATANGTDASTNHYLQCWMRAPNSSNNVGLCWRFIDSGNFYFLTLQPSSGLRIFRRATPCLTPPGPGPCNTLLIGPVLTIVDNTWYRIVVRHVGNIIQVYFNNLYATGGLVEGPSVTVTDTSPLVGSGPAGLTSTSQNANGAAGPQWNDFKVSDGTPETIYVDTAHNGGAAGAGMGTVGDPDLNIDYALANAGCERGATIKVASAVPIGDTFQPVTFAIGHQGKFGSAAYTFPTYNPDNGRVLTAGNPNLTIESADGQRVTLAESEVVGKSFFQPRSDATGIVIRGFTFDLQDDTSLGVDTGTDPDQADLDHAVHLAKCDFMFSDAANIAAVDVDSTGELRFELHYCYGRPTFNGTKIQWVRITERVRQFIADFCIFEGGITGSPMTSGVLSGLNADPQAGDVWRINHCDFLDIFNAGATEAAFSVLDPANFNADVAFRNNIIRGGTAIQPTSFGVYTAGLALGASGSILCNNNGYHFVTTPRDTGATDNGAEITGDPGFNNPSTPFEWQHTQGGGVNGEGTFLPITLDGDYRPTNPDYIDSADDSSELLGVLDRGALQTYIEEAPPQPGGGSEVEVEDVYCVSVIYDRGGPNETDLSSRLQSTRPLRQEKDVLLRQYKASDTELTFADTDGIFIEINPGSFLRGPDGRINWLGKPVDVFITQGPTTLVRYRGFVINVQAGRGTGTLSLGNRFQRIFDRIAFANSMGRVVSTTQAPGMGDAFFGDLLAPATGSWLTRVTLNFQSPFDSNQAPFVETLRFSFLSAGVTAQFSCTGSLTGPKGFGSVDQPFIASDGSFSINDPTDWENEGLITAGQECSILLAWRPTAGVTIIDALLEFLTDDHACAIDLGDIDATSFDSFRGTVADQPVALVAPPVPSVPKSRLVVDTSDPLLRYLLEFALHVGCSLIERADGRFALNSLVPRAYDLGEIPVLCKSDDLMAMAIDHLDVYNVYNFEYNRSETLDRYQSGGRWPPTFNESFDKYGRLLPAPNAMSFRGYDEGARAWIEIIAQSIFIRYQDPARIYSGKNKISRMDADLDTVYRIDSEGPTFEGPIVEPFVIQRNATGDLTVDTELLEIRVLTEECGDFLWYDNEIMGYDDECWGYF